MYRLGNIHCWLKGSNFGSHGTPTGESPVLTRSQEILLFLEVQVFIENLAFFKYITRPDVPVVKVILERRAVIHELNILPLTAFLS